MLKAPIADSTRAHAFDKIASYLHPTNVLESVQFRRLALEFSDGTSTDFIYQLYQDLVYDCIAIGNSTEAIHMANESLDKLKDASPKYQALAHRLPTIIYVQVRDFEKAIYHGKIVVEMARKHRPDDLAGCLNLLGEAYIHAEYNEEGISLLNESSDLLSKGKPDPDNYSTVVANMIFTSLGYLQMDELDSSKAILLRTSEMLAERRDPSREMLVWLLWSEFYEATGEYEMALAYVDSCLPLAIELNNITFQLAIWEYSSRIHAKMGDFPGALEYAKRLLEYKDSIDTQEVENSVQILNNNHEFKIESIKAKLQREQLQAELKAKDEHFQKTQLYFVLALLITIGIIMYLIFRNRHRKSKLLASELALKNVQIQTELDKNAANLSNNILRIASLNSFIGEIQKELESNKGELKDGQLNMVNRLIRKIKSRSDSKIWQEFEIRFEEAHQGFYQQLIRDFPGLSPNERRLCAFLKLNMTSKEISHITGQTPHSINVARGRLRKKLNIAKENISLVEFISRY